MDIDTLFDFPLHRQCPVFLYHVGETRGFEATAERFSSGSFFCLTTEVFAPSEEVECEVRIPGRNRAAVRFRAEVLRVIADRQIEGYGIECRLLNYRIHRSATAEATALPMGVGLAWA